MQKILIYAYPDLSIIISTVMIGSDGAGVQAGGPDPVPQESGM